MTSRQRRSTAFERIATLACVALALSAVGAARAPASAEPTSLCIPVLMSCTTSPSPSPPQTPTPTPNPPSPGTPLGGLLGGGGSVIGSPSGSGSSAVAPLVATPDPGAPTFTQPSAQLGASSISFSGIRSVSLVTVPLADGSTTSALKLVADSITIDDLVLDVRHQAGGTAAVTTADVMSLTGNVQVYLDSATATLPDGSGLTFGTATPLPGNELPPSMFRVTLGLIGVTATHIGYTDLDLSIS